MPAPESSRHPEIDLSDAQLPIGPVLEAALREPVTEMALLTPERLFLRAAAMCRLFGRTEAELTGLARRAIGADGAAIPMLVATTMLRGETGEELCFFVLEERARLLDGTVHIESAPGQGTVVRAALPVPPAGNVAIGREGVAARPSEGGR